MTGAVRSRRGGRQHRSAARTADGRRRPPRRGCARADGRAGDHRRGVRARRLPGRRLRCRHARHPGARGRRTACAHRREHGCCTRRHPAQLEPHPSRTTGRALRATAPSASATSCPTRGRGAYIEQLHRAIVATASAAFDAPRGGIRSLRARACRPRHQPARSAIPTGSCDASAGTRPGWSTAPSPSSSRSARMAARSRPSWATARTRSPPGVEYVGYSPDYPGWLRDVAAASSRVESACTSRARPAT